MSIEMTPAELTALIDGRVNAVLDIEFPHRFRSQMVNDPAAFTNLVFDTLLENLSIQMNEVSMEWDNEERTGICAEVYFNGALICETEHLLLPKVNLSGLRYTDR